MIGKLKSLFCTFICLIILCLPSSAHSAHVITKNGVGEYQKIYLKNVVLRKMGMIARGVKSILTIKLITPEKRTRTIASEMLAFNLDTDNISELKELISFIIEEYSSVFSIKTIYIRKDKSCELYFFDVIICWNT